MALPATGHRIVTFIYVRSATDLMLTPMDRGFGDDVFRKMARLKMARQAGLPLPDKTPGNIEEPIVSED